MSQRNSGSDTAFLRDQLEIARRQLMAIERGDLSGAKAAGNRLNGSLPAIVKCLKNGNGTEDSSADEARALVMEICALQTRGREFLLRGRDELARLLQEIRTGRQMLGRYRSGIKRQVLFDIKC